MVTDHAIPNTLKLNERSGRDQQVNWDWVQKNLEALRNRLAISR